MSRLIRAFGIARQKFAWAAEIPFCANHLWMSRTKVGTLFSELTHKFIYGKFAGNETQGETERL